MLHEWQQDFARGLCDQGTVPVALRDNQRRFAIYRDSVTASLVAALGEAFPVTRLLVGDRFFDAVAADYARQEPPHIPRLSAYGGTYPDYLRRLPTLHDLPYVADVAQLEWARIEAYFTGPAVQLIQPDSLLGYAPEILPLLRLQPEASLRVITGESAIWSIWIAHQGDSQDLEHIDVGEAQAVRLSCATDGVVMSQIALGHAVFLLALGEGHSIFTAAETAMAADAGFDLQASLASELRLGSFSDIAGPEGLD